VDIDASINVVCGITSIPHGVHKRSPVRLAVHWHTFYQQTLNDVNSCINLGVVAVPYLERNAS